TSIEELAELLDVEHIADHLYTAGQPDPDLVIRTSGEQRLGGFLLWQSVHSEFYFCDAYWPAFRRGDFLRALPSYPPRHRRVRARTAPGRWVLPGFDPGLYRRNWRAVRSRPREGPRHPRACCLGTQARRAQGRRPARRGPARSFSPVWKSERGTVVVPRGERVASSS